MADYKVGQRLYYRQGNDLGLEVEVLISRSNEKDESYELKVHRIIKGDERSLSDFVSGFAKIKVGDTFYCIRQRESLSESLWDLTETLPGLGGGT